MPASRYGVTSNSASGNDEVLDPLDLWSEVFRTLLLSTSTALLADATVVIGTVWRDTEDLAALLRALPADAIWLRRSLLVGLGALGVAPEPRERLDQPAGFGGGLLATIMAVGAHDPVRVPAVLESLATLTTRHEHRAKLEDAAGLAAVGTWLEGIG
jgi:hypothetical protein